MNELPSGWITAKLGDLAVEVRNGISEKPDADEGLPILRISAVRPLRIDISDVRHLPTSFPGADTYILKKDDLLFTRYNGNRELVGACALLKFVDHSLVYPDKLIRVRLNQTIALPAYIEKVSNSQLARNYLDQKLKTSAGQIGVSGADIKAMPLPLPPMPEQHRIADKLDTVLARVDAVNARLERVAPLLKRFRQAVLAAATSGRLTEEWRKGTEPEWQLLAAEQACAKVQSGGTPKSGFSEHGIPFLKVYNIVDQKLDFEHRPQFVSPEIHSTELKKSQVLPGDVLMNIVGPPLFKVAVVTTDYDQWNINQAITLFRPSKLISSHWLFIVLSEGQQIRDVLKYTKGSVGQINISLSQCRAFQLPVPSVVEQTEIVRRVELLFGYADRLEARLKAAQTAAGRLTPALLAKAFRGELVPQDPNDEPASELLRRLAESRAAAPERKTRGRRAAA